MYIDNSIKNYRNISLCFCCIYSRFFVKDIKTSSIYKYDEPPELVEHEKRHALPNVETLTNDDVKH